MPEHFPRVPTSEMISVEPEPVKALLKSGTGPRPLDALAGSSSETLDSGHYEAEDMISMKDPSTSDNDHEEEKKSFIQINVEATREGEKKIEPEKKPTGCLKSSLGVFLGLISGLANSLVALLVKLIESIGTFEIAVFRYVVMLVPLIFTLGCKRTNPFAWSLVKKSGWALVLRAVVGSASTYCKYFALRRLPLADASVILFSSPVFASIMARIFLKEPFHWIHGGAIAVSLGGCILVSRPSFIFGSEGYNPVVEGDTVFADQNITNVTDTAAFQMDDHMWGCMSALASAIFSASVFVTVRHMKAVDSTIVLFWTAFVGLIISVAATAATDHFVFPTNILEICYIIGVGILTLISQEALTRALKLESAGLISLLRTGDIVWAFIWQVVIWHKLPHYFSLIGAVMVVFCVSFISLREAADKLPADSKLGIFLRKLNRAMDEATCCCCRRKKKTEDSAVVEALKVGT